ncbi:MAG: hypothetical protein C0519_06705 [Hyphomicrobium sp.]|nr:hypothetical protein [Hyphomicrobium sp.]
MRSALPILSHDFDRRMRGTRPGKARRTLNIRVSRIESCAAHDQKSAPRRHLKARRATRHASVPA